MVSGPGPLAVQKPGAVALASPPHLAIDEGAEQAGGATRHRLPVHIHDRGHGHRVGKVGLYKDPAVGALRAGRDRCDPKGDTSSTYGHAQSSCLCTPGIYRTRSAPRIALLVLRPIGKAGWHSKLKLKFK